MSRKRTRFSIVSSVDDTDSTARSTSIIQKQVNTVSDFPSEISATSHTENASLPITQSKTAENSIVIWLNLDADQSNEDMDRSANQLQYVFQSIRVFTDPNECIDFITDIVDEEIFLIMSGSHMQTLVCNIDDISKLYFIYIFDAQNVYEEADFQECRKIKGIFAGIEYICDAIKRDVCRLMIDLTPFSIVSATSSPNVDELDQSFMYTQLIKETILEIEHDANAKEQFVRFCLNNCSNNNEAQSKLLEQFQRCYEDHSPIWWYARESFLYATLNKALRTRDTKTIIKMAFFLADLHREIEKEHSKTPQTTKISVYRGQGMSSDEFEKLKKTEGGLISFNSFLSTSLNRNVSFMYADSARQKRNTTGILFHIEVNPSISSTPYVNVNKIGYSGSEEQEMLFSMHTVFRIGHLNKIEDGLWEVTLKLTGDNDPQLKRLLDFVREEIAVEDGWARMALLMHKLGKFDDSLEIYNTLLQTTYDADPDTLQLLQTSIVTEMSELHRSMGHFSTALDQLEKTAKIWEDVLPPNHPLIGRIYNRIGIVQHSCGNYGVALDYFEKSLELHRKMSQTDHPNIGDIYSNIGSTHLSLGNHSSALTHFEKAFEIQQNVLPSNHPSLGLTCCNIGVQHLHMGKYSSALLYFEQGLEIMRKSLPPDHPHLALIYIHLGIAHQSLNAHSSALNNFEKTLDICQKSLPPSHPFIAMSNINIGSVYHTTGNYSVALSHYEKALAIQQQSLPANHSDLATCHHTIGWLYNTIGDASTALPHLEKAVEIIQISLPLDHPYLANIYVTIGETCRLLGNYPTALSYFEKALVIQQKSLPPDHPVLTKTYMSIALMNQLTMNDVSALSNLERMIEVQQKYTSDNQTVLNRSHHNTEAVHQYLDHSSKAVSQVKTVMEQHQKLFPSNNSEKAWTDTETDEAENMLQNFSNGISNFEEMLHIQQRLPRSNQLDLMGSVVNTTDQDQLIQNLLNMFSCLKNVFRTDYNLSGDDNSDAQVSMEHLVTAMSHFDNFLQIIQKSRPRNDPYVASNYNVIGSALSTFGCYSHALTYFEKALDIIHKYLSNHHSLLAQTYNNAAKALDNLERYAEAIDYTRRAVDTARSFLGQDHAETKAYENQLLQLRRKMRQ